MSISNLRNSLCGRLSAPYAESQPCRLPKGPVIIFERERDAKIRGAGYRYKYIIYSIKSLTIVPYCSHSSISKLCKNRQFCLPKFNRVVLFPHRLVGDNIDYHIQARYQSTDRTNQSIHWTQQYAVLNRIDISSFDNSKPQMMLRDIQLSNVLPSNAVLKSFKWNCSVLVSRVISKYLDSFQHMQDCVVRHISHKYSEEMSQKSEIVSHNTA